MQSGQHPSFDDSLPQQRPSDGSPDISNPRPKPPQPANEARRVATLQRYRILDTLPEEFFDNIVALIASICETPIGLISFIDSDRQWFKAKRGFTSRELPRDSSFCTHTILQPYELMIVPDTDTDARFREHPHVLGPPFIRFYAGAPLVTRQGFALGTLCVIDTVPRELSPTQRTALQILSRSVIDELELRALSADALNRQQALAEMVHQLSAELNPDLILQRAVQAIQRLQLWESVGISLLSADGRYWQTRAEDRMPPGEVGNPHSIQSGIIGRAYRSGEIQYVPDVQSDPDFFLGEDVPQVGSELAVPIMFDGAVLGVMNLESDFPDAFSSDDIGFARSICAILAIALKNAQRLDALQQEIGERARTEAALHTSNQLFSQMAEHVQEVFWMFDCQQQQLIYLSPAYEAIWGHSPAKRYTGTQRHHDTLLPEDVPILLDAQQRQTRGEKTSVEYRIVRPDGTIRWIYDRSFPIFDADGKLIRITGIAADITERKQADDQNRYLANLIGNISDAVISCDPGFVIRSWNRAAERIYGRQATEVIGKRVSDVLPTTHIHDHPDTVRQRFDTHGIWRGEVIQYHRDGTPIYILSSVVKVFDSDGNPTEIIAVNRNMSEQKHAEAALRLSEEKYRGLMESLDSLIAAIDAAGRILYINDVAAEHLGMPAEAVIGKQLHDLFPGERAAGQLASIRKVLHEDRGDVSVSRTPVFGGERWYRTSIQPIHDEHGRPVYALINATDIDELKTTQQELLDLTHTLEERVKQRTAEVQDLYEHAPAGYHSLDPEGRFIIINETELRWLGYSREEVIGRPFTDVINAPSQVIFRRYFPLLKQRGWVHDLEYEFVRKDGTTFSGLLSATSVYDEQGNFVMTRSTLLDNSERKRAEAALRIANAEMERALRTKDEFLANMSHELRTPLNAILALSESLLEEIRGPLNPRQRESLHHIEQSGRHLLELINDILDLSKVEAGQLDLQIASVSIADSCRASLQFVREIALKKRLQLAFLINDELADINADPKRLKQMLANLLSNAVKFTPEGGKVSLEVTVKPEQGIVALAVRDSGIGISAADMSRLFQPFTQLDSGLSRQHEGTGLGLTLVSRLAKLHGGNVTAESEPGKGSCFTIFLPLARKPTSPAGQPPIIPSSLSTPTPVESGNRTTANTQVLLVEDNEVNLQSIRDYLSEKGLRISAASNGREALEQAAVVLPDVIVMDIQMPEMDGFEAIKRLRADPRFAATPIIALTALAMAGDRERCLAAGANEYLTKPVRLKELFAAIQTLLRR